MHADLLLRHATVIDPDGLQTGVDLAIANGQVIAIGPALTAAAGETIDLQGGVLVPSFINAHHHFATGLLRGAPSPALPARNQRERLERVIWPFERRLTHDDVRVAVQAGLLEAIAAGATLVIDHHVSSGCIAGVLDVIATEVASSGLRAILCYEITDRDGEAVAAAGLAETARFLAQPLPEHVAGMVGLHAMSTVGPATLQRAVTLADRFQTGLHLHLGESRFDNDDSQSGYGARPLARLETTQALSPRTLLAHAIHVTDEEISLLGERDVAIAHLPRSNAANGVGITNLPRLMAAGCTIGLGGDGFTQDMRADLGLIPLLQRQEQRDPTLLPPRACIDVALTGGAEIVSRHAGWGVGRIAPGYSADLVAIDYDPVVPLLPHNALWHLATGLPGGQVRDVWIAGVQVYRNGEHLTLDAERIRHDTVLHSQALWTMT